MEVCNPDHLKFLTISKFDWKSLTFSPRRARKSLFFERRSRERSISALAERPRSQTSLVPSRSLPAHTTGRETSWRPPNFAPKIASWRRTPEYYSTRLTSNCLMWELVHRRKALKHLLGLPCCHIILLHSWACLPNDVGREGDKDWDLTGEEPITWLSRLLRLWVWVSERWL